MRPLIIGEAPNRNGNPRTPVEGRCGARLAGFAGIDEAAYLRAFQRVNLLSTWPGPGVAKGDDFDHAAAREFAADMRRRFRANRVVLLLGKRVAAAFGLRCDYLREQRLVGARVFVVPHPSGINRWYNSLTHRCEMEMFMHRVTDGSL